MGIPLKKMTNNMPEEKPINNSAPANTDTGADPKGVTTPPKTDNPPVANFDPAKISDAEFEKVFDDPRTFNHSRFKELTNAQKELKALRDKEAKEKEKALAEQGKFKELADQKDQELAKLREQSKTQVANLDILAAASKLGAVDPKVVLKLIDRANITVDEDGTVTGAEDAVKKLLESAPYLKGKPGATDIGAPSNPDGTGAGVKRFKHSQIKDPVFYREHEKEITEALRLNLVENDL